MPKVAIIEDNALNLKLFRDLLEAEGCTVVTTDDGNIAVGLIRREQPDLVLMDIQLHGRSGVEVIKDLKADAELKKIPVIAVTAFAMKDDEIKVMECGCDAYISKPISIIPFVETVKRFLPQES
jgi:two-component system cell cycle response regulator DivK